MALNRFFHDHPLFGFDDFLLPRPLIFDDPLKDFMPVIPSLDRNANMILRASSPGYEIHQIDGMYQICLDVAGAKQASDITVTLEQDGKVLHIAGGRKTTKEDGSFSEMNFEKRFTVGSNMDVDKITAKLADGVLTLSAPIKEEVEKPVVTIAITEEGKPEEEEEEAEGFAFLRRATPTGTAQKWHGVK